MCLYYFLNMKLLIVAATPTEINAIKKWVKSAQLKANLDVDYLCCWIWNYETIFNLQNYLSKHSEPVFIRNIWICGYWNSSNTKMNSPIQVATVLNIHTKKEFILPPFIKIAPMKNCFSSENPIKDISMIKDSLPWIDELYFDMESRWIGFVSLKQKLPHIILKVPFDFIWQETNALYNENWKFVWKNIADCLEHLQYHDYLEKILDWIKNISCNKV